MIIFNLCKYPLTQKCQDKLSFILCSTSELKIIDRCKQYVKDIDLGKQWDLVGVSSNDVVIVPNIINADLSVRKQLARQNITCRIVKLDDLLK